MMKSYLPILLVVLAITSGCGDSANSGTTSATTTTGATVEPVDPNHGKGNHGKDILAPKKPIARLPDTFVFAGVTAYWKPDSRRLDGLYDSVHELFQNCGSKEFDQVPKDTVKYSEGTCDALPKMCLMRVVNRDSLNRPKIKLVPNVKIELDTMRRQVHLQDLSGNKISSKAIPDDEIRHIVRVNRQQIIEKNQPVLIFRNRDLKVK